jgi:hypothetical protein
MTINQLRSTLKKHKLSERITLLSLKFVLQSVMRLLYHCKSSPKIELSLSIRYRLPLNDINRPTIFNHIISPPWLAMIKQRSKNQAWRAAKYKADVGSDPSRFLTILLNLHV